MLENIAFLWKYDPLSFTMTSLKLMIKRFIWALIFIRRYTVKVLISYQINSV